MLKDKKIIIHKTDGKTFIPITGRSYRTDSSHGFLLSFIFFQMSHFVCNPSCCFVICKTRKTNDSLRERCVFFFLTSLLPSLSTALQVKPARWLQEESAAGCPSLSSVVGEHYPKRLIKCVNMQTKRGLFSSTSFAPWDEDSRTKHILVAKKPSPCNVIGVKSSKIGLVRWKVSSVLS